MNRMRTVIVDDEQLARDRLRRLLSMRESLVEVVGEAGTADEAEGLIYASQADLVFLDIVMPGRDGIDLASRLGPRPAVVFTTAHADRMLEVFDTYAMHYLIKPIDIDKVDRALAKVQRVQLKRFRTSVSCRTGNHVEIVPVEDVLAFESDSKYTFVRVSRERDKEAREHIIDIPLIALEECLDPQMFVRASRSALVNLNKLRGFTSMPDGRLELRFDEDQELQIAVSRRHANAFRQL
jgi:DNA-binding LytR/AlgR family response regulator